MNKPSLYELFKKDAVKADSVEDFLNRYYKHDRYRGRGEEYAAILLAGRKADFELEGFALISHHDSVTGQVVAFYG